MRSQFSQGLSMLRNEHSFGVHHNNMFERESAAGNNGGDKGGGGGGANEGNADGEFANEGNVDGEFERGGGSGANEDREKDKYPANSLAKVRACTATCNN